MTAATFPQPAARVEGGALGVGTGLLMLLREALEPLPVGALVAAHSADPAAAHDFPAWCRLVGHDFLGSEPEAAGGTYYFRKGEFAAPTGPKPDWGIRVAYLRDPDSNLIEVNSSMPTSEWTDELRAEGEKYGTSTE